MSKKEQQKKRSLKIDSLGGGHDESEDGVVDALGLHLADGLGLAHLGVHVHRAEGRVQDVDAARERER